MTYVERRRQLIEPALAALAGRVAALTAELAGPPGREPAEVQAELDLAQLHHTQLFVELWAYDHAPAGELTDQTSELTLLSWLWPIPADAQRLADLVAEDSLTVGLGAPPAVSVADVAAVLGLVGPGRPGRDLFPRAVAAIGADATDALVAYVVRVRLESAPGARPPGVTRDVTVALPVRLETLFRTTAEGWTMLLRIVPDEASVRRDAPDPTPTEVTLLAAMWQAAYDALADRGLAPADWLREDSSAVAWETFCGQVAPARAGWLAGTYGPVVAGDTVTVDVAGVAHESPPNRVGGFPESIDVWCAFVGDAEPRLLARTTVDRTALVFDVVGGRAAADGTVDEQADRWWVSWPRAVEVGLGLEIPLPDGLGPADIATLYSVGVAEENPAEHLRAQVDAGELAYLPLGAPTNAVDGAQAASLGHDAASWRVTASTRLAGFADRELSRRLTGTDDALPVPPAAPGVRGLDQILVRALWPALWGHHLRDVWGFGEDADRLAAWAADHLRPEGPLPPVRIAEQPYGLLPVAPMAEWRPADEEDDTAQCEGRFAEPLLALRRAAAAAARAQGTVVGADTARLLELLGRDAVSAGYAYRLFLPVELASALYAAYTGVDRDVYTEQVRETYRDAMELFAQEPARWYVGAGDAGELALPLVVPQSWPDFFWRPGEVDDGGNPVPAMSTEEGVARILELLVQERFLPYDMIREEWRMMPDSLLFRLLLSAQMLAVAAMAEVNAGSTRPLLEELIAAPGSPTRLRAGWDPGGPDHHPAGFVRRLQRDGLEQLAKLFTEPPAGLVSQVDRALRSTLDTAMYRVDPWLTGMAARRLVYLSEQPDTRFRLGVYGWVDGPMLGEPGPTAGGLLHAPSHAQALTAVILRDKAVTAGLDPEPDGRELWSMQLDSDRIRLAEELAEEVRLGAHLFEVVGRQVERVVGTSAGVAALRSQFPVRGEAAGRVCSGLAALAALRSGAPPLPVSADQAAALQAIQDAVDAYGDLLVTEAVHQVVTGRADLAGAAMDAAAGLAGPPTLAFTETPLAAEGLTSAVVTALPYLPPDPGLTPAALADPSVAAALVDRFGPADDWSWGPVSLADLGLEPVDTLVLSAELLTALAGFRGGTADGTGAGFHRQARDLVRALGTQPALPSDLADGLVPEEDAAALAELTTRYGLLRDAAAAAIDALRTAADGPALIDALRTALRWGITPTLEDGQRQRWFAALLDGTEPAEPEMLPALAADAADTLSARLRAAPEPGDRVPVGRSIAELAAPEGQLAVLGCFSLGFLGLAPDPGLDEDWLPVVAAVRPHPARLEALQLEALVGGAAGFAPVSTAPGDPWQTAALAVLRETPGRRTALPRFVAGYGLGDVWAFDVPVAVGLVDSWSESVPQARQTTTAAVGFNAPAARPPQAILLAVPPDLSAGYGAPADTGSLLRAVVDAREAAHARAVRTEDLGALLAAVPTALLDGTGDTGVRLTGTGI